MSTDTEQMMADFEATPIATDIDLERSEDEFGCPFYADLLTRELFQAYCVGRMHDG